MILVWYTCWEYQAVRIKNSAHCWWVCYHSIHVFCCFWWLIIFAQSSKEIYNLDTILECVVGLWEFMWCHFDHFWPFVMFLFIFNLYLLISDLSLHWWTIYVSPILWYTHFVCFQPSLTFSDLSLYLFIFTVVNILILLIICSFDWLHYLLKVWMSIPLDY